MRLLFVSEDVTLAQVVRLVVLARTLDPQRHEIHFACRQFSELVFRPGEFIRHTIGTITRAQLEQALARGHRLYDRDTLRGYVAEEIALIEAIEPDLIIGDFRLSLTVSAPACQVPLAALINAYWSPRAELRRFPLPDHPIIGTLGEAVAGLFFPLARPWVFAHFARPINQLRKEHGLAAIGSLREVLTHADYTLYPDVPSLTPIRDLPESQIFLGPVQWAPPVSLPSWWDEWTGSAERPLVYVTMGSSGDVSALSAVMDGLATLPVAVVVATAGRTAGLLDADGLPDNARAVDFVPGDQVCAQAALVVSNGGSTTGYQALAAGTPVLGIASNLDQHLAMTAIEERGAGLRLRAQGLRAERVRVSASALLDSQDARDAARQVAADFAELDSAALFPRFVDRLAGADGAALRKSEGA